MKTLPNKPSELIRVALADLRECEDDPNYDIHMSSWHTFNNVTAKCQVCLAGAVMAKTFEVPLRKAMGPDDPEFNSGQQVAFKLFALDQIREGKIYHGVWTIMAADIKTKDIEKIRKVEWDNLPIPHHRIDREGFHKTLQKVADGLEAIGY